VPVSTAGLVRPSLPTAFTARRLVRAGSVDVVTQVAGDTTPPVTLFVSETKTRVSAITGFTTTDVTWSADEDCQAWEIRDVTGTGQTVADGVLVASGGAISAGVEQITTIASSALSAGEGAKTLKLFAQDLAGNWTT
jgi:hypothetical protein